MGWDMPLDDDYAYSDDDLYEAENRPADEEIDEPELLEYDDWVEDSDDEPRFTDEDYPEPELITPDPDEPLTTDTEAERSGKLLRREMKAEALRRMEESARTQKDFEAVVAAWDKRDDNKSRTVRNHEQLRSDIPLDYGVKDKSSATVFPVWMGSPMERQIARGNFLDLFANCPYEMHDLTGKEYIRCSIKEMKEKYKELLYFMGIQGKNPQEMAVIRGKTDRNIRKIRDTMLEKMQKRLYDGLMEWIAHGYEPTHREEDFLKRYMAGLEGTDDEAV